MGNSPPSPDEVKSQFENAFDPNKNGLADSVNNSNDKIETAFNDLGHDTQTAFQKGGAVNDILVKAGDGARQVGGILQKVGGGIGSVGMGVSGLGLPGIGVPLALVGGAVGSAGLASSGLGNVAQGTQEAFY